MTKQELIARAEAEHAQYPQYAGYWNGPEWHVYRALRTDRPSKGLPRYQAGELLLGKYEWPILQWDGAGSFFVQPVNWCTYSTAHGDFELVEE